MRTTLILLLGSVLSACSSADDPASQTPAAAGTPAAPAAALVVREPQAILDEMARARQALQPFDEAKRGDAAYFQQYREQNTPAWNWLCELSLELMRTHPEHGHVLLMMRERWRLQCTELGFFDSALREMEALMAEPKTSPALADEARYSRALALLGQLQLTLDRPDEKLLVQAQAAVDALLTLEPADARGAELLWQLALLYDGNAKQERATYTRLLETYPNASRVGLYRGKLRQLDAVGQSFEMPPFQDASSGREVDLAAWRGKWIVVVFWAARAQPALDRLAEYQRLAAEYAPRGVEFVGVSLDEKVEKGGRDLLLKTVAERGLSWPQNYLGAAWISPFSVSWGITRLPQVFVVDQAGKLVSCSAQADLEGTLRKALALEPLGAAPAQGDKH